MPMCVGIMGKGCVHLEQKLWTKEFVILFLVNFLLNAVSFLLLVTMSSYAVEMYGVKVSTAGFTVSIFVLGSLFGRLLAGKWIKIFGIGKGLIFGLAEEAVISIGYFFAYGAGFLQLIRLLHGLTIGMVSTMASTISVQMIPPARRGEGISCHSLSSVLGMAVGPFVGMAFTEYHHGYEWMFFLNFMTGLVCIFIIKAAKIQFPGVEQVSAAKTQRALRFCDFIDKQALPISLLMLFLGFGFSSVTSYLKLYSEETGLVEAGGYYFLIHSLCVIFSRPFTGKIMDAKGANIVVYPCILLFASGMFLYSQSTENWMILVAAACMALGFGNFNSTAQTIAVKNAEPSRLWVATATYFMFIDLGVGLGPYLLGYVIESVGFRLLYEFAALMGLLCIPIYYLIYGSKEKHFSLSK